MTKGFVSQKEEKEEIWIWHWVPIRISWHQERSASINCRLNIIRFETTACKPSYIRAFHCLRICCRQSFVATQIQNSYSSPWFLRFDVETLSALWCMRGDWTCRRFSTALGVLGTISWEGDAIGDASLWEEILISGRQYSQGNEISELHSTVCICQIQIHYLGGIPKWSRISWKLKKADLPWRQEALTNAWRLSVSGTVQM